MDTPKKRKRRQQIYDLSGGECFYCGRVIAFKEATIDHIVPKSKGGSWRLENLVLACRKCNRIKGQIENIDEAVRKIKLYWVLGRERRIKKFQNKSVDKKVQSEQDKNVL